METYPFEDKEFNESEKRVIQSFQADETFPQSSADMVKWLQQKEEAKPSQTGLNPVKKKLSATAQICDRHKAHEMSLTEKLLHKYYSLVCLPHLQFCF